MTWRSFLVALAVLSSGCQRHIGDSCALHTDCSQTGDRICEPNLPGGYCTQFNCEPGSCPSEAVCVAYGNSPSVDARCAGSTDRRLQRTFCMFACETSDDCRAGYQCVDLGPGSTTNPWNAKIADNTTRHKICTVLLSAPPENLSATSAQVCNPTDASFPPPLPPPVFDGGPDGRLDGSLDAALPSDAALPPRDARAPDATLGDSAAP